MIKIGIIDDEILARKVLEDYCSKIDNFELVLSTGNPLEFVNFTQQKEVDLIFLDIEMPELNGMEILRSMINPPKVILTTAYSEYALEKIATIAYDCGFGNVTSFNLAFKAETKLTPSQYRTQYSAA